MSPCILQLFPASFLCWRSVWVQLLSIFGGLGIIIAYTCFRSDKQMTGFRDFHHILVCVSIADILIACGHLWGVTTDLERFLDIYYPGNSTAPPPDQQCVVQASVTFYRTMTSFMWAMVLAGLTFTVIKCKERTAEWWFSKLAFTIYQIVCWTLSLIGNYILAQLKLLGYDSGYRWVYKYLCDNAREDQ